MNIEIIPEECENAHSFDLFSTPPRACLKCGYLQPVLARTIDDYAAQAEAVNLQVLNRFVGRTVVAVESGNSGYSAGLTFDDKTMLKIAGYDDGITLDTFPPLEVQPPTEARWDHANGDGTMQVRYVTPKDPDGSGR